jgi:hypothetical protein
MSPPASQRAERITQCVRINPKNCAAAERGADGAARHPYQKNPAVRLSRIIPFLNLPKLVRLYMVQAWHWPATQRRLFSVHEPNVNANASICQFEAFLFIP